MEPNPKPKHSSSNEIKIDVDLAISKNKLNHSSILSELSIENLIDLKSNQAIKFYKKENILKILAQRILSAKNGSINSKGYFQDLQFLNNSDSLYGAGNLSFNSFYEEDLKSLSEDKSWMNVNDLYNTIAITNNNFSPFDLVQGALSDCYFLSALAAIAKFPELILKLFVKFNLQLLIDNMCSEKDLEKLNSEEFISKIFSCNILENNEELYFDDLIKINDFYIKNYDLIQGFILRIRLHGEWNYILIDGYLPTYKNYPSLIFARSNSSDLWVSLIEKVWAKVLGGYYETSLGSPSEGFLSLTDSPTEVITHKYLENESQLWDKTQGSMKKEWILACIIQLKAEKTKYYKEIGLITNHCYTIIRLIEAKVNRKILRFILLRNPHGHSNFSGNYSDYDPKWTKDLKNICNFEEKDPASFFMSFEDYFKYFDHTFICKYDKKKTYKSFKISKNLILNKTGVFLLMKVTNPGEIIMTLHQKYKRIFKKGYKNTVAQLLIFKLIGKNETSTNTQEVFSDIAMCELEYIKGTNSNKSVNLENNFSSGLFLIYAGLNYTEKISGFVISTYAEKVMNDGIELKIYNCKSEDKNEKSLSTAFNMFDLYMEKIMVSICRLNKNIKKDYYNFEERNPSIEKSYKIVTLNELDNGFGIIFIENKSKNVTINTKIIIKDIFGLECQNAGETKILKNNSEFLINLQTKSMSYNLIYFKKIKMRCGFKVSFTETFSYSLEYLKLNIKKIGEKKEILIKESKSGVFIYSISHGSGYFLLVENTSKKNVIIKLIFTKLENLFSNKIKLNETNEFSLAPGKTNQYIFSSVNDKLLTNSVMYKYAASF